MCVVLRIKEVVCLCHQDSGSNWDTMYKRKDKRQSHLPQTFLLHYPRRLNPALADSSRDHAGRSEAEASLSDDRKMQAEHGNYNHTLVRHMVFFLENCTVPHPVNNSPAFKVHCRIDKTPATILYQLNSSTLSCQMSLRLPLSFHLCLGLSNCLSSRSFVINIL
jgi:hypothetical protein